MGFWEKTLSMKHQLTYKVLAAITIKRSNNKAIMWASGNRRGNFYESWVWFNFVLVLFQQMHPLHDNICFGKRYRQIQRGYCRGFENFIFPVKNLLIWEHGAAGNMFRLIPKKRVETASPGNTGTAPITSNGSYVPFSGAEGLATTCCKRNRWEGKNNRCELWKIFIVQENKTCEVWTEKVLQQWPEGGTREDTSPAVALAGCPSSWNGTWPC